MVGDNIKIIGRRCYLKREVTFDFYVTSFKISIELFLRRSVHQQDRYCAYSHLSPQGTRIFAYYTKVSSVLLFVAFTIVQF